MFFEFFLVAILKFIFAKLSKKNDICKFFTKKIIIKIGFLDFFSYLCINKT